MDTKRAKCFECASEPHITCKSCQLHFCRKCLGHHVTFGKGSKHEIVQFIDAEIFQGLVLPYCDNHKNQKCELQCRQCKTHVCPICIIDSHKRHDIDQIPMLVEQKKSEIKSEIHAIESTTLEFTKIEKEINKQLLEMKEENELVFLQMEKRSEKLKESVNKVVSDYKIIMENATQENAEKLHMFKENMQKKVELLQESKVEKTELLHRNVALDILHFEKNTFAPSLPPVLHFDPIAKLMYSEKQLEDLSNHFGKLSLRKSSVSGNLLLVESIVDSENEDFPIEKDDLFVVDRETYFSGSTRLTALRLRDGNFGCIHQNEIVLKNSEIPIQLGEWWLPIGTENAEIILSESNVSAGTYFISEENDSFYMMSIRTGSLENMPDVSHVLISKLNNDAVYLQKKNVFPHLQALIEHYQNNSEILDEMPCSPTVPFPHQLSTMEYSCQEIQRENIVIKDLSEEFEDFCIYSGNLRNKEPISIHIFKIPKSEYEIGLIETANDVIQQAEEMRSFSHENILHLIGVCFISQPIALITEPVNSSIRLYLENITYLDDNEVLKTLQQIIKGMAYLHQQGFAHGWLCAENIFIRDPTAIKIGLSQFTKRLATDPVVINGSVTPVRWAAPELFFQNHFGTKSDVWCFGMLLYEIVTLGKYPYPDLTDEEVKFKMKRRYKMPKPKGLQKENYYQVMQMCWELDVSKRPAFSKLEEGFKETFVLPSKSNEIENIPPQLQEYWLPIHDERLGDILLQKVIPDGTFFIGEGDPFKRNGMSIFTITFKYVNRYGCPVLARLEITRSHAEPITYSLDGQGDFPDLSSLLEYYQDVDIPVTDAYGTCTLNEPLKHQTPSILFTGFEIDRAVITLSERLQVLQLYDIYEGHLQTAKKYSMFIYKLPEDYSEKPKNVILSQNAADDAVREAINLCKFSNENILEILGMCSTASPLVKVTEFVMCTLLQHLQESSAQLTVQEINDAVVNITSGMEYLHESRYIHRDLCASNIFLGEHNKLKVGGLHFAEYLHQDPMLMSKCENIPLQYRWCAPEVLLNIEYGSQSDVWSFGIVLFEIVSNGKVPYEAFKETEIKEQVGKGCRIPRPLNCTDFHHEMMNLCLNVDCTRRPPFRALKKIFTNQGFSKSFKRKEIQKVIKSDGFSDFLS